MSFGLLKANTPPIAVDFGVSSLKVLQILPGDSPSLLWSAHAQTPDELLDKPNERLAYQSNELARLLRSGDFRGKRAVCSVSATLTFVQHVQTQRTEGVSLDNMVAQRVGELTGRDATSYILRHIEVGEVIRAGARRSEVMCVAIPREAVISHMRALRTCKLEPVGVHTEHLALVRSIDHLNKRAEDSQYATLLVDVGYSATKLVMAHGREPVMARTLLVGGRHLDALSAKQAGCDLSEARRRRITGLSLAATEKAEPARAAMAGAPASAGAYQPNNGNDAAGTMARSADDTVAVAEDRRIGMPSPGLTSIEAGAETGGRGAEAMALFRETLADEISLAVRYHRALFPDKTVQRVIFFGGESVHADMCRYIATELRLPARLGDPLAALAKSTAGRTEPKADARPSPAWAVAMGLCVSPTDL